MRGIDRRLCDLLMKTPALESLTVVTGDVDLGHSGSVKPIGTVELTQLTRGAYQQDLSPGIEVKLQAWVERLLHSSLGVSQPLVPIKQGLRGDKLMKVHSLSPVTDWARLSLEDPAAYKTAGT